MFIMSTVGMSVWTLVTTSDQWLRILGPELRTLDCSALNSSTVVEPDMATVVLSSDSTTEFSVRAGHSSVTPNKREPTPVPTAGETIRSFSSLGSNAGCFLLNRDALAMLRL